MVRAIIGFPRINDDWTFTGGSWNVTDFPLTNLIVDEYARVARSDSAAEADTIIIGTAANLKPMRAIGIAAHNLTLDAEYRLRLYDSVDSPSTLLFDSLRQRAWPGVYLYTGRYWETFNFWTGQYTQAEIEGQIPFTPGESKLLPA